MYTVPVQQAGSQLRQLIERTRKTQQPVVFTTEATDEAVAVLVESSVFEELRKYKWQLFYLRARELQRQLDRLGELLPDRHLLEPIIEDYKNGVEGLWRICPEPQQGICVTLMMASRRLKQGRVNADQLAALRDTFALLRDETPSEADIRACHRKLIACGLPPMMTGSKELAELYEKDL